MMEYDVKVNGENVLKQFEKICKKHQKMLD